MGELRLPAGGRARHGQHLQAQHHHDTKAGREQQRKPDVIRINVGPQTHEADHAVIGRVLHLHCGKSTIEPDCDSAGHSIIAGSEEIWELDFSITEGRRIRVTLLQALRADVHHVGPCRSEGEFMFIFSSLSEPRKDSLS